MNNLSAIQMFAIWVLPVLFGITVHEVCHGWVALKCGDRTAQMMGRLTLNPIKHIDPIGTIVVPTILFFLGGFIFGWAKPVPVTWQNLRNRKRDMALVALAGPAANLVMCIIWALIAKIGLLIYPSMQSLGTALAYMGQAGILINLVLMILNLIPVPPLDGSRVVSSFLRGKADYYYSRLEPFGLIILLVLLATGMLARIMGPALMFFYKLVLTLFGLG